MRKPTHSKHIAIVRSSRASFDRLSPALCCVFVWRTGQANLKHKGLNEDEEGSALFLEELEKVSLNVLRVF